MLAVFRMQMTVITISVSMAVSQMTRVSHTFSSCTFSGTEHLGISGTGIL